MNTLGLLTLETIKSAPEKVAIPAMEFWSTICDEAPKGWQENGGNTARSLGNTADYTKLEGRDFRRWIQITLKN